MKPWVDLRQEYPELSAAGLRLLFPSGGNVGMAFLATLRRDGAPRLHPVSLVHASDRLFVFIPHLSPKCADLLRDGRYALQAFPPPRNQAGEEFYLAGSASCIQVQEQRAAIITATGIRVAEDETGFELLLHRAMYTRLDEPGTPAERPIHIIWPRSLHRKENRPG